MGGQVTTAIVDYFAQPPKSTGSTRDAWRRGALARAEARAEVAAGRALLLVEGRVAAAAVFAVAAAATRAAAEAGALAHERAMGARGELVRVRHDLRGEVQELAQVLEALKQSAH